jgi:hypothetical protein
MRHQTFQRAARAAFSTEDWLLLGDEPTFQKSFTDLASIEEVEDFVFRAYDHLRDLREQRPAVSGISHG